MSDETEYTDSLIGNHPAGKTWKWTGSFQDELETKDPIVELTRLVSTVGTSLDERRAIVAAVAAIDSDLLVKMLIATSETIGFGIAQYKGDSGYPECPNPSDIHLFAMTMAKVDALRTVIDLIADAIQGRIEW